MKKTLLTIFVVGILLGAAVAAWGVVSFKGNAVVEGRELYVGRDVTYEALMDSIKPSIKYHLAFDLYAERLNLENSYKKGHYVVKDGMNVIEIVRMLKLGLQTPVNVTMNNVKIPAQLAGKLAAQIEADSGEIVEVLTDKALAKELGLGVEEKPFSMVELMNADEIIVTSSSALCIRVATIDKIPVGGKDPERIKLLQDAYWNKFVTETTPKA